MNQKKENKKLYEEIESEIVALPAWSAHECALLYLSGLCDELVKAMKELGLDASDLEKARKEAEKACELPRTTCRSRVVRGFVLSAQVEGLPAYTGQTHALYPLLRRVLIFCCTFCSCRCRSCFKSSPLTAMDAYPMLSDVVARSPDLHFFA